MELTNKVCVNVGRVLLLAALLLANGVAAVAQSAHERMNDIKLSGMYYTAESTAHNHDQAFMAAFNTLLSAINMEQMELGHSPIVARQLENHVKSLDIGRGQDVMVFVYVEKARLSLMQDSEVSSGSAPTASAQPSPSVSNPSTASTQPSAAQSPSTAASGALPDVVARLLNAESFTSAHWILDNACNAGEIAAYGTPRTMSHTDGCYILVVDADRRVVTVLSPKTGGRRTNLRNGSVADMAGYKGCSAICFL